MTSDDIRSRLPELYRPREGDGTLIDTVVSSVEAALTSAKETAFSVMRSHWIAYADRVKYDADYQKFIKKAIPQSILDGFLRIDELARIAASVPVLPWLEPADSPETVKNFRRRVMDTIALIRNGFSTINAIRGAVRLSMPQGTDRYGIVPELPFVIEEFPGLDAIGGEITQRGDAITPFSRWTTRNYGHGPVPVTLTLTGVAASSGGTSLTVDPLVELRLSEESSPVTWRGIAYKGTVPAGRTLRIRPAYSSLLCCGAGFLRSDSSPNGAAPADPTAPGPWSPWNAPPLAGDGLHPIKACQTTDGMLWLGHLRDGGGLTIRALDDSTVRGTYIVEDAKVTELCFLADGGSSLLAGTNAGLFELPLYDTEDQTPRRRAGVLGDVNLGVRACASTMEGEVLFGTDKGLLSEAGPAPWSPGEIRIDTLSRGNLGSMYAGGPFGLIKYQPWSEKWYRYLYGARSHGDEAKWIDLNNGADARYSFGIPPVNALAVQSDGTVWMGTRDGLCRLHSRRSAAGERRPVGPLSYETLLEAFPSLGTGPVECLKFDEVGSLWIGSHGGLFRYDGRRFSRWGSSGWTILLDLDPPSDPFAKGPPVSVAWRWRLDSAEGSPWSSWDEGTKGWIPLPRFPATRTDSIVSVHDILWIDRAEAELEESGSDAPYASLDPSHLVARVKTTPDTILNGGIPALPRVPCGEARWRYMQLEIPDSTGKAPGWSIEGRAIGQLTDPPGPLPGSFYGVAGVRRVSAGTAESLDQTADGFDVSHSRLVGRDQPITLERSRAESEFDAVAFAYPPSAIVQMEFAPRIGREILVRLKPEGDRTIDPIVIGRILDAIRMVRPVCVRVALAVNDTIVGSV